MTAERMPLTVFAIPFGLAGLAGCWLAMAHDGLAPPAAGEAVLACCALVWLVVLSRYLHRVRRVRGALTRDLADPVTGPFASLAMITPMMLAAEGLHPYAPGPGRVLTDLFGALTVLLGAWFTGQWIYRPVALATLHPGYFLPTVAGGLIASAAAEQVGQHRLAQLMFGVGAISWLVLGALISGRLLLRPALPPSLLPTLAIEVAPAAVASLAYFGLDGGRVNAVAAFLGGYGLLMALAQIRLLPAYLRLPFMPSTWAFTFSWAAVATAAMHWLSDTRPDGYPAYQYLLLAGVTALIGGIGIRALASAGRRQPPPGPAPLKREAERAPV